jgi:hypothetical protein
MGKVVTGQVVMGQVVTGQVVTGQVVMGQVVTGQHNSNGGGSISADCCHAIKKIMFSFLTSPFKIDKFSILKLY